jgi:hypothetical protein
MRTKNSAAIVGGLLAAIVTAYLWFFGPLRYFPRQSPSGTEKSLRAALPLGTSVAAVLTYLENQKIEHSEYLRPSRVVYAIRRNTCHMILVECDTEVTLSFDEDNRLTAIHVRPGFTGL